MRLDLPRLNTPFFPAPRTRVILRAARAWLLANPPVNGEAARGLGVWGPLVRAPTVAQYVQCPQNLYVTYLIGFAVSPWSPFTPFKCCTEFASKRISASEIGWYPKARKVRPGIEGAVSAKPDSVKLKHEGKKQVTLYERTSSIGYGQTALGASKGPYMTRVYPGLSSKDYWLVSWSPTSPWQSHSSSVFPTPIYTGPSCSKAD